MSDTSPRTAPPFLYDRSGAWYPTTESCWRTVVVLTGSGLKSAEKMAMGCVAPTGQ